jgi:2-dehydro-3-deoxy-D-gluconate 5-dehydrogenase
MFDLSGKIAIVTGGSRGIGAAIALGLAAAGADLLLVSRNAPNDETRSALETSGRRFAHHAADLSQTNSIALTVAAALEHFGRIDILVNNAGIVRRAPALEYSETDWDDVLGTNLKVPVFLAQACAQQMVKQGDGGKIVNVCSLLSFQGGINIMAYAAAKHGLAGVTKALANELAKHRINVNGLAPGYIETDFTEALQRDTSRYQSILGRIPYGRWGTAADLTGAAVFLCSPAADYMTGHILAVDGGWLSA